MDTVLQKTVQTVDKYHLLDGVRTVVAAVSGGYDSMCMLSLLAQMRAMRRFELCVAHFNHAFRKEADGDQEYVRNVCREMGVPFYSKKADVAAYAKEHNISFETAGRLLRYEFFEQVMAQLPQSVTATAHNRNDSAESFMMHLLRGSGLKGLEGIRPKTGSVIRPLIDLDRTEIEEYCNSHGIVPRHDVTNDSDLYTRNDLRHNVMPLLQERGGLAGIARTAGIISAEEDFMSRHINALAQQYILKSEDGFSIRIDDFNPLHTALKRRLLITMLPDTGMQMGLTHIDAVIGMAAKRVGNKQIQLPGGAVAQLCNGMLTIKENV